MSPVAEVMLGLDVGTTAVKAVAFDVTGGRGQIATASQEYPLEQPVPGWQVQDPPTILAAIDAALRHCVTQVSGASVQGIGVSTAMHGLLGLDEDCEALTPLVTWADARAQEETRAIRVSDAGRELLRRTGTPVHPMSPLTKLAWFSRHEPDLVRRARWWVGLKDYVLHHLTGQLVTELSSASGTGLLNLRDRDWDVDALRLAGVRRVQLPPVRPTTDLLRLTAERATSTGLRPGLPVGVGAGDGPLGNLGTGAITPGVAGLSLGTSGAIRMAVDRPSFDEAGRLFCYALTEDVWVTGGAISNGGITLRWAGETFAPDLVSEGHADEDVLELAAHAPAGCDGLLMLPYVISERAPLWDPKLSGAFLGIRAHHTRGHFIRAAMEGVCLQLYAIMQSLDSLDRVDAIRATGGAFRSDLWRQVMAATLGRPLSVTTAAGGTALGAAALGWYGLGGSDSLTSAVAAVGGIDADSAADLVDVSDADVAAYHELRGQIGALVNSYESVAALFVERPADPLRGLGDPD